MEKVKRAIDAGISFPVAVRENLGMEVQELCAKRKLIRQEFSAMLNGRRVPDEKQLKALIGVIGGDRDGWLDLWFKVARRKVAEVARAS